MAENKITRSHLARLFISWGYWTFVENAKNKTAGSTHGERDFIGEMDGTTNVVAIRWSNHYQWTPNTKRKSPKNENDLQIEGLAADAPSG